MKFVIKSTLIAITIFVILSLATSRSASKSKTKEIRLIKVKTDKTSEGNGNISKLKNLNIKCPTGSAISDFKLQRGGKKINYTHHCLAHLAISTDSQVQYTQWDDLKDKGTNYLDRQKVQCSTGKVLSQFKLETNKNETKMRYQFTCTKADLGTCFDKVTPKTKGGKNYESIYLDRQNKIKVTNNKKQVLIGFKLQTDNYSWNPFKDYNVKYSYKIKYCDLNKQKEPEQNVTQEKIAEDEKDTQANIVDHREREVRRRRFK